MNDQITQLTEDESFVHKSDRDQAVHLSYLKIYKEFKNDLLARVFLIKKMQEWNNLDMYNKW